MYNTAADIHFPGVYTLSHENPTAKFNNVTTINIFGLQLPKSGDKNDISHDIAIYHLFSSPAQLPNSENSTVCIANAIPFENRTMLLTVRTL